ncbi:putative hydro-lyase [Actinomadura sp. 9N215]|uniref:putative hydro-lyase n=1 Tax=Actinomadura sp. 9N215 TaxID=3375150 RepID=UPI00379BE085
MTATLPGAPSLPEEAWSANRLNERVTNTGGICPGYVQANLAILPKRDAFDFMRFAQRNPRPCPILEVTDPGDPEPKLTAPGADLRTDLPRYAVYRSGQLVDTPTDIVGLWTDDMVAFLIGCSYSFEHLLVAEGLPARHLEQGVNGSVFLSNIECVPAGKFRGKMVVSMQPIPAGLVEKAVEITAAHPEVHGGPVHIGAPEQLGIHDLAQPQWGDVVRLAPGDVPVFWGCGITPQQAAIESCAELMITHYAGHMFVTSQRI